MARTISYAEVQAHRSQNDCWVILYGNVYDVSCFLADHPGGAKVIIQLAGTDATEEFDPVHPPGTLENSLPAEAKIGIVDKGTLPTKQSSQVSITRSSFDDNALASLEDCLNLDDIEALATKKISQRAWAYYYGAADDLHSKAFNNSVYRSILLRPRIFVDVTRCDTSTSILGHKVNVPFYVAPAAMARLAHSDGEHGIAKACQTFGAMQIISNNASQTPEQIVAGASPDQLFGWQLYVQTDRKKSEDMLARIAELPAIKFICLTLDAPVPGKREHDERTKSVAASLPVTSTTQDGSASTTSAAPVTGGVGKALFAGTAPDLTWSNTLPWLRKHTNLPVILKGLQTHEDAYLASLHAPHVKGIILSNHGGRAADTAPPSIHTLLEIRKYCPEVFSKLEVFVDGGVRRGTDVVKALCLGATAVGLGRSPLYGLGAGGIDGVKRVLEILKAETETAMRLLGCHSVKQLGPRQVNSRRVEGEIYDGPDGLEEPTSRARSKL
jgi:isopentenyl diphosphate isomerase/L-lactate dehydrogenase-like FMN-dependent dehydrogenase